MTLAPGTPNHPGPRTAGQRGGVPRRFSVADANRALPLVRRIVEDIVAEYARWREMVHEYELASAVSTADAPNPDAEHFQRATQASAEEIEQFVAELEALGVHFKGFDLGLVDFPAERDGREVFLCWKLGEPSVAFWHDIEDGFSGRRPLHPLAAG